MSSSLRKLPTMLAMALLLYMGVSGPLAGLVCCAERVDPAHHDFWTAMYARHLEF